MESLKFLLVFLFIFYLNIDVVTSSTCVVTYSNLGIYGNNIEGVTGSASQCCQFCQQKTGCLAYTWDNTSGGTCWLKNATQPLYKINGTSSGILSPTASATYSLNQMYAAPNFLNDWTFVYHSLTNVTKDVNEATAQNLSLIGYPNNSQVYLGVDHTNLWPNNIWRPSIQIESHYLYNSGLFILSLDHMPTGPGVWPAFWMAGPNWPYNGEIDVLEAVDGMPHNLISILSGDNCYHYENETQFMNGNWYNPGHTQGLTCYAYAKSNATYTHSCSVNAPNNTFGPGFNKAGGGVFAVQWEKEKFIRVWNFVKPNIPIDIVQESPNPNPDTWGLPDAYFSFGSNCSPDHFNNQSIIFDIALCGGWEAGYYPGGEAACEANVKANPGNYTEAYFLINYLKVFCKPGEPCGTYYPSCQVSC